MVPEINHKLNARVSLLQELETPGAVLTLRIMKWSDGLYLNFTTSTFEMIVGGAESDYVLAFNELSDTGLQSLVLDTLPSTVQDLLFEYTETVYDVDETTVLSTSVRYERHLFGGGATLGGVTLCTVYGTLIDVSGKPLANQKVESFLNRGGFFTHKSGLVGNAVHTITDDAGYFELPLIIGLDVTISIPVIGFSVRGFVPNVQSVQLTSQSLLSYSP